MGLFISLSIVTTWITSLGFALSLPAVSLAHIRILDVVLFGWLQILFVGLFIIAHDACHGTVAPGRPRINLWLGRISAFLYAGFFFDELRQKHQNHHKFSGTELDPDFLKRREGSGHYLLWILRFFKKYVTLRQLLIMTVCSQILMHVLKLPESNVLFFWVAPSLVSAVQLFTFGTYLPHRALKNNSDFVDHHSARNSTQSFWASLFLCYHFGSCHLRHHQEPAVPWYQLYQKSKK